MSMRSTKGHNVGATWGMTSDVLVADLEFSGPKVPVQAKSITTVHVVLNATSLQPIPAHSGQSLGLAQTFAGVGPSESEWAGVGF